MRGSKKTTKKINFYLSVLNQLKESTNLSKIQDKLGISKQNLNYYLRGLKKKGLIAQKGNGWYEVLESSKKTTKYGSDLKKDDIRGHAYIWDVELPKEVIGWNRRIGILNRKKINYKLVGALKTTPRIKALGRKIWLCNDKIKIFDTKKASYYGDNAKISRENSTLELLRIVNCLENKLGFIFKPLKFSVRREHYALIRNDLAIHHNREGIKLEIRDENGDVWLLVDDSLQKGGELETIGKKALKTNIPLQKWWNQKKKNNFNIDDEYITKNISTANEMIKKLSEQNIMMSQVLEQVTNNQKRTMIEVIKLGGKI